ncbi:hypothetical protein [Streptomyces sp. CBMA152]|uniref:hypothetical protein n=1 Tax=Streptomyces sp. CBMA152 TaxID=1896312 RepID=UPI0016603F44|nr:hypothetical protein [Streptomyces sp. CBMA152]MBD0742787.1 hypothetical protein [Streptomyces sp. CBMA152]
MVIVAVLFPPLMLSVVLGLARYEERIFGVSESEQGGAPDSAQPEPPVRHLHAVRDHRADAPPAWGVRRRNAARHRQTPRRVA